MGCGTIDAMNGGVKRMPPPMTLATMMAAASNGPRRLSRDVGVGEGTKRYWCEHLSRDLPLAELGPLIAAVLGKHLDVSVDELAVFQHLRARFDASVSEVRPQDDGFGGAARRDGVHADRLMKGAAPFLGLADATDDRVQLHVGDRLAADVLERQRDGRQQLVHAVLDAGIEPPGSHVDRLDKLGDGLARAAPAGGRRQPGRSQASGSSTSGVMCIFY